MKNSFCSINVAVLASVLLATSPAILAQKGAMGANSQQQQGVAPSTGLPDAQSITEPAFVGQMRRNGDVKTDLSKLALKKSSSDAVKKLAQQMISTTRKSQVELTSAVSANPNLGDLPYEPIPDITRQAKKQMKALTGPQVDQIYLIQMNIYVQDDQRTIAAASLSLKSSDLEMALPRLKNIADDQAKQIAQVAQSENIKLE